jgi:ketosteroid isomerase-like protein
MNDPEIEELVARTHAGNTEFINGRFADVVHEYYSSEPSVMGPFGGAFTGTIPVEAAKHLWAQFKGGTTRTEVLASFRSGDLIVLSQIEHQEVLFDGDAAPQNWSLRVTLVYRRETQGWRVVHRHADPLVRQRSLEEAKALARG